MSTNPLMLMAWDRSGEIEVIDCQVETVPMRIRSAYEDRKVYCFVDIIMWILSVISGMKWINTIGFVRNNVKWICATKDYLHLGICTLHRENHLLQNNYTGTGGFNYPEGAQKFICIMSSTRSHWWMVAALKQARTFYFFHFSIDSIDI